MKEQPKPVEVSARAACPKCGSKLVYLRLVADQFVCRQCGHTWERKQVQS